MKRDALVAAMREGIRIDREQCGATSNEFAVREVFGGYLQALAGESANQYYLLGEFVQAYATEHGWPETFRALADAMSPEVL